MNSDAGGTFREILDGTSNPILVVETVPDASIPSTKPEDLTIDLDKPKREFLDVKRLDFNSKRTDGSALYLSHEINVSMLKTFLKTRVGRTYQLLVILICLATPPRMARYWKRLTRKGHSKSDCHCLGKKLGP
ncbi:MAG TPA: hypothetical protein DEF45_25535 [Rhodopirellula sp.]|nr:MAG: hypothetical protein CBD74_04320 [Saprospirales bacterium TMED214]HBV66379.1 hypothetical protein [Rhodopirellula sp.]